MNVSGCYFKEADGLRKRWTLGIQRSFRYHSYPSKEFANLELLSLICEFFFFFLNFYYYYYFLVLVLGEKDNQNLEV